MASLISCARYSIYDPILTAIHYRVEYVKSNRWRLVALLVAVGILIAFAIVDVVDLTGTRWAVYLVLFESYLLTQLGSGVALYIYHQERGRLPPLVDDVDDEFDADDDWKGVTSPT